MARHGNNTVRFGSGRMMGAVLAGAALLGVAAVGYAIYSLSRPAASEEAIEQPMDEGVAPTETIEGVLASVQALVRDEENARARTVLESAVRQYPQDQDLRIAYADFLMLEQDQGGAYDQYVSAIEIGPSSPTMEFTAGTLASTLGKRELGEAHYTNAMRMDPTRPEYPTYLAVLQMNQGRLSEAKANLALASQLAPNDAQVWAVRASVALRENKVGIAQLHIARARELEPREVRWILTEAKIRKRAGEPEQAINLLTGLGDAELQTEEVLGLLAECFGMVGRPGDAASRYMDAAQSTEGGHAEFAFQAAVWFERGGDRENAVKWGRRARDLGHRRAGEWMESLP